jgi:hypothetical protein
MQISGKDLTPEVILQVAANDIESGLQKSAGLSKAKRLNRLLIWRITFKTEGFPRNG